MLPLCSFRGMNKKAVFWAMICIVSFVDTIQAQNNTTVPSHSTRGSFTSTLATSRQSAAGTSPEITTTAAVHVSNSSAKPNATEASAPANTEQETTQRPTVSAMNTTLAGQDLTSTGSDLGKNATLNTANTMLQEDSKETSSVQISSTSQSIRSETTHPPSTTLTAPTLHTPGQTVTLAKSKVTVECVSIQDVRATEVTCLQHHKTITCENFKQNHVTEVVETLCTATHNPSSADPSCKLTLSNSETNERCLLLIPPQDSGVKVELSDDKKTLLAKHNITLRTELPSDHRPKPKTTLIALITTGLVVAALILCGYFLSNRQSWSPGSQRLVSSYRWQNK